MPPLPSFRTNQCFFFSFLSIPLIATASADCYIHVLCPPHLPCLSTQDSQSTYYTVPLDDSRYRYILTYTKNTLNRASIEAQPPPWLSKCCLNTFMYMQKTCKTCQQLAWSFTLGFCCLGNCHSLLTSTNIIGLQLHSRGGPQVDGQGIQCP